MSERKKRKERIDREGDEEKEQKGEREREGEREYFPQKKFKGDMPWVAMRRVLHCKRTGRPDWGRDGAERVFIRKPCLVWLPVYKGKE